MQYVSATEAKTRLGAILDAAQSEPVVIQRQNRDVAIVLSPKEFDRLRGLNMAEYQAICERIATRAQEQGLTERKLRDILV